MIALSDIRDALKLGASDDVRLKNFRQQIIDLWETKTNRKWALRTGEIYVVKIDDWEWTKIWLPVRPVKLITAMTEWYKQDGEAQAVAIPATDYYLWAEDGKIERTRNLAFRDFVKITYNGGFDVGEVKQDIIEVMKLQARFMLERFGPSKLIVADERIEKSNTTYIDADLHPHFLALATQYKRVGYSA